MITRKRHIVEMSNCQNILNITWHNFWCFDTIFDVITHRLCQGILLDVMTIFLMSWRILTPYCVFDVKCTSWWSFRHYDGSSWRIFDIMMIFLTSRFVFYVMTCIWLHENCLRLYGKLLVDMTFLFSWYVLTSWWTFWRHDPFWCHNELSFDIIMYFPYFWCYDILFNIMTYFDVMTYFPYFWTSWRVSWFTFWRFDVLFDVITYFWCYFWT